MISFLTVKNNKIMNQREIEILRIGFNKGIECMENHPENNDYDSVYFELAESEVKKLTIHDVSKSACLHPFSKVHKINSKVHYCSACDKYI